MSQRNEFSLARSLADTCNDAMVRPTHLSVLNRSSRHATNKASFSPVFVASSG